MIHTQKIKRIVYILTVTGKQSKKYKTNYRNKITNNRTNRTLSLWPSLFHEKTDVLLLHLKFVICDFGALWHDAGYSCIQLFLYSPATQTSQMKTTPQQDSE